MSCYMKCEATGERFYNVIGDGACLFRSVSYALQRSEHFHQFYRNALVDHVCKYWDEPASEHQAYGYSVFARRDAVELRPDLTRPPGPGNMAPEVPYESAAQYREFMSRVGTYAGHTELGILGTLFRFNPWMLVITSKQEAQPFGTVREGNDRVIAFRTTSLDTLQAHWGVYNQVPTLRSGVGPYGPAHHLPLKVSPPSPRKVKPPFQPPVTPSPTQGRDDWPPLSKRPPPLPAGPPTTSSCPDRKGDTQVGQELPREWCDAANCMYVCVPANANSLFASLSLGRYNTVERVTKLRVAVSKAVSFNKEKVNLFYFEKGRKFTSAGEYQRDIQTNVVSGSSVEAKYLTRHLGRSLAIISVTQTIDGPVAALEHVFRCEGSEIVVLRQTEVVGSAPHYDLFLNIPDNFFDDIMLLCASQPLSPVKKNKNYKVKDEKSTVVEVDNPGKAGLNANTDFTLCGSGFPSRFICKATNSAYLTERRDGNSLFRAVSMGLFKVQIQQRDIRQAVVKHVVQHWKHFKDDSRRIDGNVSKFRMVTSYEKWMKLTTSTPHIAEVRAIAELYDIRIVWVNIVRCDQVLTAQLQGVYGTNRSKVLILRVSNFGTRSQIFELFVTLSVYLRKLIASVLPGSGLSQTEEDNPAKPVPGKIASVKTPKTPKTPQTPKKRPGNNNDSLDTPKRPKLDDRNRKDGSEDEGIDDVPNDAFVWVHNPVDIVTGNYGECHFFDDDDSLPGSDGEESSSDSDNDSDKEDVERPKPWVALNSCPIEKAYFSRVNHVRRNSFMSAAVYGDEAWEDLEPLRLPPYSYTCPECGAKFRSTETVVGGGTNDCCHRGKVKLHPTCVFRRPSEERILKLYTNDDPLSEHFKANILPYNRMFSTVQFIARGLTSTRRGPTSVITVNGKVTYNPNCFFDQDLVSPGQLYFVEQDTDTIARRMATSSEGLQLEVELVELFENYLQEHNDFVQCFKTTREVMAEERQRAEAEGRAVRDVVLAINPKPKNRAGYRVAMEDHINYMLDNEYARPCRDFVAAVFVGNYSDFNYDTLYAARRQHEGEPFAPLKGHEPTVDVQTYPLIHLHGEQSWSKGERDGTVCTVRDYYKLRLQIRDEDAEYSPLLMSGKLLSQYVLDAAIKIEYDKLLYFSNNQVRIKASSYRTLLAYINSESVKLGRRVDMGRFKVLPDTMPNSPRYRQKRFLNGMAIARTFGTPSYFITMTCNPRWPEIQAQLNGRHWMERPDVVARAFQDRKRRLLADLIDKQLFGRVVAYFTTDEFQKSSLPHTHILITMHPDDRPVTSDDVDRFISAEIPRRSKNKAQQQYRRLVTEHMMHHACHAAPRRPGQQLPGCFADGQKCRFRFPQAFADKTDIEGRRVQYKRRANGRTIECRQYRVPLDNRNVVPHNRYLLMRHQCHINVEYKKSTLQSYKYLCVYVNKNPDKVYVSLTTVNRNNESHTEWYEWDEVDHFKEMRYMSPTEAVYIIMSYSFGECSHSVVVLPVHLEGENDVNFPDGQELEVDMTNKEKTMLTEWFALNLKTQDDSGLRGNNFYVDINTTHTWDRKLKKWNVRRKGANSCIARIALITPTPRTMELFYLRTLLLNIPGPTGFQDMKTVNGVPFDSYKSACAELGLIQREDEAYGILNELSGLVGASYLRYQFCMVVKHCSVCDASQLWESFKEFLSDDFSYKHGSDRPSELHFNMALARIYELFLELDVNASSLNLPQVDAALLRNMAEEMDLQPGLPSFVFFSTDQADEALQSLNDDQRVVFDSVQQAIQSDSDVVDRLFFIHGAGGVGKTYLYNTIIKYCIAYDINVAACAATGIAAILLILGMTAHSLFGIPANPEKDKVATNAVNSNINTESKAAETLRQTKVFIWDEVSMVHAWQLNLVDRFLRALMRSDKPMGGKIFIFGGDFRQTLPVIRHGSRCDQIATTIMNSNIWPQLIVYQLTQNVRAAEDPAFADWLLTVGNAQANVRGTSRLEIPWKHHNQTLKQVIDKVFGVVGHPNAEDAIILTPKNSYMREVNDIVFERVPGTERTYLSSNSFYPDETAVGADSYNITPEILQEYESANLPPHRLRLKEGCIVMLLCNLHVAGGLCNGTRLRVLSLHERSVRAEILNGPSAGQDTYLFRVKLSRDEDLPGTIMREQMPIRLAYSATVTKGQGSTFNRVGIFLPEPCFSHGQLYVALSRAKRSDNVHICLRPGPEQGIAGKRRKDTEKVIFTRNEVYLEVLHAIQHHPNLR